MNNVETRLWQFYILAIGFNLPTFCLIFPYYYYYFFIFVTLILVTHVLIVCVMDTLDKVYSLKHQISDYKYARGFSIVVVMVTTLMLVSVPQIPEINQSTPLGSF